MRGTRRGGGRVRVQILRRSSGGRVAKSGNVGAGAGVEEWGESEGGGDGEVGIGFANGGGGGDEGQ